MDVDEAVGHVVTTELTSQRGAEDATGPPVDGDAVLVGTVLVGTGGNGR